MHVIDTPKTNELSHVHLHVLATLMGKDVEILEQHPEFLKELLGFRISESESGYPVVTLPFSSIIEYLRNGPYRMSNLEALCKRISDKVPVDRIFLEYLLAHNGAPVSDPSIHYAAEKTHYCYGDERGSVELYMISASKLMFLLSSLYARIGTKEVHNAALQINQTRIELDNLNTYMGMAVNDLKTFTSSSSYLSYDRTVQLNILGQAVAEGRLVKEAGTTEVTSILTLIIMDSTDEKNPNGYAKYSRAKYHTSESGVSKGTYDNKMKWLVEASILEEHAVHKNQYRVRVDILKKYAA